MVTSEMLAELGTASPDNLKFVSVNLYTGLGDMGQVSPHMSGTMIGVDHAFQDGDTMFYSGTVLDPGRPVGNTSFRSLQQGNKVTFTNYMADVVDMPEDTVDLEAAYKQVEAERAAAPYQIMGRLYAEEKTFFSWDKEERFPKFDAVQGTERTWEVGPNDRLADGRSVSCLNDVECWVLENHPDYLQGFSAAKRFPSGDFILTPAPGPDYPPGQYATREERRDYAVFRAKALGVEPGKEDAWKAVDEQMRSRRPLPDISFMEGMQDDTYELGS